MVCEFSEVNVTPEVWIAEVEKRFFRAARCKDGVIAVYACTGDLFAKDYGGLELTLLSWPPVPGVGGY